MQVKCQRCDKLFSPVSTEKYCSDCLDGKPVVRYTPQKRKMGIYVLFVVSGSTPKTSLKKLVGGIVQKNAEKNKIRHGELRIKNK